MANFNFQDLQYSVSKYFSDKKNYVIAITCDDGIEIFNQPFNLIAFDDQSNVHGVFIMHYAEQLQEMLLQETPLRGGMAIQNTWVCLNIEIYEKCKNLIDEYTGVLFYQRTSNDDYKIVIHKKADKQHDYFLTQDMLLSLLKIQSNNLMFEHAFQRDIIRLRNSGLNI